LGGTGSRKVRSGGVGQALKPMTFTNMGPEASEKLRSIFPFHLLLAVVLLIFIYMIAGGGVGDPDIWWHLKNAQYLFTTGKLPSFDMYSFTVAGHPWINHEWLAEIPYYLAWRAFGLPGIWVVFLGVVIFGIVGAAGLVGGQWGRIEARKWSREELGHLVKVGLASVGSLFVNPYGWKLVYYPFDLAYRQKLNIANIEEWASVDFHLGRGKIVFFLIAVLLCGALVDRRKWKLPDLALAVFGLYCGLTYVRFL